MTTFRERRQNARDAGDRAAQDAIAELNIGADPIDFEAVIQRITDHILTETDGAEYMHSARLQAYHNIVYRFGRIIDGE